MKRFLLFLPHFNHQLVEQFIVLCLLLDEIRLSLVEHHEKDQKHFVGVGLSFKQQLPINPKFL